MPAPFDSGGRLRANCGNFCGIAGLLLIVLRGGMMVLAIIRFRKIALDIDAKELRPGTGAWLALTLVTLLVLLGATLFVYLVDAVISRF